MKNTYHFEDAIWQLNELKRSSNPDPKAKAKAKAKAKETLIKGLGESFVDEMSDPDEQSKPKSDFMSALESL